MGNRIEHRATPPGGSETIATLGYPATSNRVTQITQNATTVRSIGYDAAGNITSDSRLGSVYAYTYNKANRLKTVSYEGNLKGTTPRIASGRRWRPGPGQALQRPAPAD